VSTAESALKRCFVIAPIGEKDSETRKRSDTVLRYIIRPTLKRFSYEVVRADEIAEPGLITNQVVERLRDDALVRQPECFLRTRCAKLCKEAGDTLIARRSGTSFRRRQQQNNLLRPNLGGW
jgi:hypothetical protein